MKIRNGFVSNSSSSSFVLIVQEDYTPNYENEQIEKIYEDAFYNRIANFNGKRVKIYTGWASDGENSFTDLVSLDEYCEKNNIDKWEFADDLYDRFPDYFEKDKFIYVYTGD